MTQLLIVLALTLMLSYAWITWMKATFLMICVREMEQIEKTLRANKVYPFASLLFETRLDLFLRWFQREIVPEFDALLAGAISWIPLVILFVVRLLCL